MAKLSIIIPFGTSLERPYIKERVEEKAKRFQTNENIEYIFVEGFSSFVHPHLKILIETQGHMYLKDEKQEKFSLGMCRNLGICFANSPCVMSLDVDCCVSDESLQQILRYIHIKKIDTNPNAFLVLPCVFLSETGSELLLKEDEKFWDSIVKQDLFYQKKLIKFFAPASSSIVLNRHRFLELGGNDLDFIGHGYEDFDLYMRILRESADFEALPKDISFDTRSWNFTSFKGFRSLFALTAYEAMFYGIYLYHFYHIEPNQNGYLDNRELNHQKFYQKLKAQQNIDTLQSKEAMKAKVLLLSRENSNVSNSLRSLSVYLGEFLHKHDDLFFDDEKFDEKSFLKYLQENNITNIIFPNSYSNDKRLQIYHFCKEKGLPFIVYDRGALPDSWFFDGKGFNFDSSSYDEKNWNKNLSQEQILAVQEYIQKLKKEENFLEEQGCEEGENLLRRELGVRHKRVIFVALQVPTDSVIKYFSYEPFKSDFLCIINKIATNFAKKDIVFVAKKHPLDLSLDKSKYKNIIFAKDDTNLNDLLNLSDAVLTLNSGVGVYAIAFNKPCILCANAFYGFEGLNLQAKDENELIECIDKIFSGSFKFDTLKALKFIHFLRFEFYSFGKSFYKKSQENGRIFTRVYKIEFYQLVINMKKILEFKSIEKQKYTLESLVYAPYLHQIKNGKFKCSEVLDTVVDSSPSLKFKFLRLFKNLKAFIMDSKNPLLSPLRMFYFR